MNYHITAVDTTAEGHLYVVVDFGDGLIEDFVFVNLPAPAVSETVRQAIADFAADIERLGYQGDRRDPNYMLGGTDHATKRAAMVLLGEHGTI